tara:strand:- start:105 stop:317 length:213 start_codon:yes stop_codon:yes gene_type:complete
MSILIDTKRDRVRQIRDAIEHVASNPENGKIDKKKFIREIMGKYGVGRKIAVDYLYAAGYKDDKDEESLL